MTERACIVGGGVSGIASAYALSQAGIDFDCFETGSAAGGLWRFENDSGLSAMYSSLITNTPRQRMEFFGYKMSGTSGDYLGPGQIVEYLERFIDHAGLMSRITFATEVTAVEPLEPSGFRVTVRARSGNVSTQEYGAVLLAHGRNWTPVRPNPPGEFAGRTMHAFEYRTPEVFRGQRAVVAGFGSSGVDIVSDAAEISGRAVLASRNGGYLLPRYLGGRPVDQSVHPWLFRLPRAVRIALMRRLVLPRRGFSKKVCRALESRARLMAKAPVISDRIAPLIEQDRVVIRPAITRLDGHRIHFADETSEECDILVWATGYRTDYPFFSSELVEHNQRFLHRYLRVIPPDQPGLYFVGHVSALSSAFPIVELQAVWVSELLAGRCALPHPEIMKMLARQESARAARDFPEVNRPYDFLETVPYRKALTRELAEGAKRAASAKNAKAL